MGLYPLVHAMTSIQIKAQGLKPIEPIQTTEVTINTINDHKIFMKYFYSQSLE